MSGSKSSISEDGDVFACLYQALKFRDNVDKIDLAHVKRLKLLLNNLESQRYNDRTLTNWLLAENVEEYVNIVDDRDGLNNYAEYINDLCSKSLKPATECSKWSTKLEDFDSIESLITELSLNEKTSEENEADAVILRNLRSKIREHETIEDVSISVAKQTKNVHQSTKPNNLTRSTSTFQTKSSPVTNMNSTFNPARSFLATVTPQEPHNTRASVSLKKRSINEVDSDFTTCASSETLNAFRTAKTEMNIQNMKKYGNPHAENRTGLKRSLGARSRSVNSKFVPPIKSEISENQWSDSQGSEDNEMEDERLKNLDPKMIELIRNEIMDHGTLITWDDICGLEFAKKTIQEIVVWPLLRPDIFTGLRKPPKGILFFGPPGTGKTLIGKCIASQSSSTFFSISASSLTSKWIGESEKLVRTLFSVARYFNLLQKFDHVCNDFEKAVMFNDIARCHQPAVIFIDEIDSLLSQRNESEHESSRRIKTEFLVQLDGATTDENDRILVIGATNRPQELDEAARRRLVKRLYIPLPEFYARRQIIERLMSTEKNDLSGEHMDEIARLTDGYSGADMKNLCQEASLEPIRSIDFQFISSIETQEVRAVTLNDFKAALRVVRSSVSSADLNQYLEWDKVYGSRGT